jgi:fructosamine-3-kinase
MIVNFFFQMALLTFFAQFYRDFYFKYENVNNHAHAEKQKEEIKKLYIYFLNQAVTLNSNKSAF